MARPLPPPRYYRSVVGCGAYFCPVRQIDAIYLVKHQGTMWVDCSWIQGHKVATPIYTLIRLDGDLREHAVRMMTIANEYIHNVNSNQLDPLIDASFDEFERIWGVGSWYKAIKAVRRSRFK